MSVDRVPFSSSPSERSDGTTPLFREKVSKCGEIFVTNNAEKWTFHCGYCQDFTSDIGAFVCHIRLRHLNLHSDSAQQQHIDQNQQNPAAEINVSTTIATSSQADTNLIGFIPTIQIAGALSTEDQQLQGELVKEQKTMDSTQGYHETICFKVSKIVDITPLIEPEGGQKEKSEDDLDPDDTDFEINNDNKASDSRKPKKYKLAIKCKKCGKGFRTARGLNIHIKSNCSTEYGPILCPVCGIKYSEKHFVTHVLTHESDTCFPCQACGKLYGSNEERMKHWKTHAEDKPFHCPICYRRFLNRTLLARHLPIHRQYRCSVCVAEFNTTEKLQKPYFCVACEKSRTNSNEGTKRAFEYKTNKVTKFLKYDDDNNSDVMSNNRASEDEYLTDLESNDASITSNNMLAKCNKSETEESTKCTDCNQIFSSIEAVNNHTAQIHGKKHAEQSAFKYVNDHIKCPICLGNCKRDYYITHISMHENNKCFPCKICAQIFTTQEERIQHLDTHNKGELFVCTICFECFRNQTLLTHHKVHNHYQCSFCPVKFEASEFQRSPYICPLCEKYPIIKRFAKHLCSLADNKQVYDTDQNFIATPHQTFTENNQDVFTITPIHSEAQTQELSSETDNKEVVKAKKEAADEIKYDDNTETIEKELDDDDGKISCYSPSEDDLDLDDDDFEINNGKKARDNHKPEKEGSSTEGDLPRYKCPYCPKRVANKNARRQHILCNHHNKLAVKCRKCNRGFHSKQGLNLHLKSHYETGHVKMSCPVCATKYSEGKFITHVLTHESDTCFPCQACGKLYGSNEERMKHWKTHAEEKPFHCPICYRRFLNRRFLASHLQIHRQYRCSVCAAEFNTTQTQQPPYVCMTCGKSGTNSNEGTSTASKMINYNDQNTDDNNSDSMSHYKPIYDKYSTDLETNDASVTSNNILTKSNTSETEKFHNCTDCTQRFTSIDTLNYHITQIHDKKNTEQSAFKCVNADIQCPLCLAKCQRNCFITHVLMHESDSCFPCQVCAKIFTSQDERMQHLDAHDKGKLFVCTICFQCFRSQKLLTHHLKTHNHYQCYFCALEFDASESQRPPYICPLCEKYPSIKQLVKHLRSLPGNKDVYDTDQNFTASHHNFVENNEDVSTITPILPEAQTPELGSETDHKQVVQVIYVKNEAADKTEYEANTETIENDKDADVGTISFYSPSEDDDDSNDTDFKINGSDKTRGGRKYKEKNVKYTTISSTECELPRYKCPYCPILYKNKKSIKTHTRLNHNDILPFRCKKCSRGFNSESGLKYHQIYHNENKLLQCPLCATKHTENQFTTHVLTHESDTCFPCQVCGEAHASHEARLQHWMTHAKEKPFPCRFCYRRFDSRIFLARHRKSHIQHYRCHICAAEFETTDMQIPPYVCPGCKNSKTKKETDDRRLLANEEAIAEIAVQSNETGSMQIVKSIKNDDSNTNCSNTQNNTDDDVLNQDDPDLEFIDESWDDNTPSGSSKLTKATSKGENKLLQKCKHCRKGFDSKKGLVMHISKVHFKNVKRWYECQFCDKIYESNNSLFSHQKTHDRTKQFQCPLCPLTDTRLSVFVRHVMQHENESCFPCQVCGKIFSTNAERVKHWESHIQERPYGCDICYRRFHHEHQLKYHMKSHVSI